MTSLTGNLESASSPAAQSGRAERTRMIIAATVVLAVYAGAVALATWELRARWRSQVLEHEGHVLGAVAAMQATLLAEESVDLPDLPGDRALEVALNTSRLRGVLAVRVFDADGQFLDALPAEVDEATLTAADLQVLASGSPVVRLHPGHPLASIILDAALDARVPLLEVTTSLDATPGVTSGAVRLQYWIDGAPIAGELRRAERHILMQAVAAFAAGAALILGTLGWAFRRLDRANRLLRERAVELARANRELAQTARTAALGAITAHLVHGVRSPFAGLEGMVAAGAGGLGAPDGEEWRAALESTRRIRSLLDEVQAVLADVGGGAEYEITAAELCAGLRERLGALADARGVRLAVDAAQDSPPLGAREAGLGGLVLANLLQNAIEATSPGRRVEVACARSGEGFIEFRVRDEGPGLPPEVAADPFRVRHSSKPSGAGIGLAISRELARHAGGCIEVVNTGSAGTDFRLRLPMAAPRANPASLR